MQPDNEPSKYRIFVLAHEDQVYNPRFFEALLDSCPENCEVLGVALVEAEAVHDSLGLIREIDGWLGWGRVLTRVLPGMSYRRLFSGLKSVRHVFEKRGIPVQVIDSPNDRAFLDRLETLNVDVISSHVFSILRERLLKMPKFGCLNRHTGKLPNYRGVLPVFHALRRDEPNVTVTYHTMTEKIDGGVVVWEHDIPVEEHDSCHSIIEKQIVPAAHGFWAALKNLTNGIGRSVEDEKGSYYRRPNSEQIREFKGRGRCYV